MFRSERERSVFRIVAINPTENDRHVRAEFSPVRERELQRVIVQRDDKIKVGIAVFSQDESKQSLQLGRPASTFCVEKFDTRNPPWILPQQHPEQALQLAVTPTVAGVVGIEDENVRRS